MDVERALSLLRSLRDGVLMTDTILMKVSELMGSVHELVIASFMGTCCGCRRCWHGMEHGKSCTALPGAPIVVNETPCMRPAHGALCSLACPCAHGSEGEGVANAPELRGRCRSPML